MRGYAFCHRNYIRTFNQKNSHLVLFTLVMIQYRREALYRNRSTFKNCEPKSYHKLYVCVCVKYIDGFLVQEKSAKFKHNIQDIKK